MNKIKNKNLILIITVLVITITVAGSTYSWWTWRSATNTTVNFTTTADFSCSANGGGNITGAGVSLIPATCTNSTHVIKRTITTTVNKNGPNNIYLDLWLNIDTIGSYLANNSDFKYTLSTSNSCTSNIVASGTFSGKSQGGQISLLNNVEHTATKTTTYYLYIWLDKSETTIPPSNESARAINLSLDGQCSNN